MSYYAPAAAATATAFVAAQESLRLAENEASSTKMMNATSPPSHASTTRLQGQPPRPLSLLSIIPLSTIRPSSGPPSPALATTLLAPSIRSLSQELEDPGASIRLIVDFRREWRRLQGLPEDRTASSLCHADISEAVAVFVDAHASNVALKNLITGWRMQRGKPVLERGDSSMSLTLEAMHRLAIF
ncbi:hypothetical protein C8J57DRAFT_694037 [Mycena rebaudengoi]|nr:hypothetical protein C8J57DRAFT_694037 [Mycena rebaudengoi]